MAGSRVPGDPPQSRRTFTHPDLRRIGRLRDPSGNAIVLVDTDYLFVATTIGAAAGTVTARRRSHGSREDAIEAGSRTAAIAIENRYLTDLLAFQAGHDSLTRLPNRSSFEARLQGAIAHASEHSEQLA